MIEHAYRYRQPCSPLLADGAAPRLSLATCNASGIDHPHFFEGRMRQPRLVAELLSAVHLIVGSRFFTPPNTVAHAIALADPVVTCGGGLLRFEGFSSCCSAYIRVDLLPAAYEGDVIGTFTTTFDFNAPMRAGWRGSAMAGRPAFGDRQRGTASSFVRHRSDRAQGRLPTRWLRGMVEVQSYLAGHATAL